MQQTTDFDTIVKNIDIPSSAYIGGKDVQALSAKTYDAISPINGKILTKIPYCDSADVDIAVGCGRRAFEKGYWSRSSVKNRKNTLLRLAEIIQENSEHFAYLETLDMGKTIAASQNDDIPAAIDCIRWYAEAIDKVYDEIAPYNADKLSLINREPIGVIAAVVPWNFPLLMACWKVAPALAAGNSVIIKPAEQSSLTAMLLAKMALKAGLPEGVLQTVTGFGDIVGKSLGKHSDVDMVAFTGSTDVGKLFLQYSGESNMKHVSLECGGKSPNIVFADCDEVEYAADCAASSVFCNNGQVCCAPTRLFVHDKIYDRFIQKVIEKSRHMMPGNPLNHNAINGSMVDEKQTDRVMRYIDCGIKEGAKITSGGKQILKNTGGFYIEPTIFENVDNNMRIAKEEIFGPVLAAIRFSADEDAIRMANDTIYGLQACLWTKDVNKIHKTSRALKCGTVIVNGTGGSDITTPFGGFKQSGIGRDQSLHALEKYTQLKTTIIHLRSSSTAKG